MAAHLVVGIDGSSESGIALRWAAAEAERRGLALRLIHALNVPIVADPYGSPVALPRVNELEKYAENLLTVAARKAHTPGSEVEITTKFEMGSPAAVLLKASHDAAGLVVGSRGLGSIGAALIGSVSVRLAGKAACPVFIIPPEVATAGPITGPVVVGVDGSIFSDAALRVALDEAALLGTSLRAVSAYHLPWLAMPTEPRLISEFDEAEREYATKVVHEALERVRTDADAAIPVEVRVVRGQPAEAIIDASRDAALTVVGSRGHGAMKRMLLGSISRAVLQEATRPLAIVHVHKKDSPRER
ncbi:universal stress protein [Microlunatus panaciterrae]|uniref:Nucleotide-binding universal stress UspA family protein n=1 Tax=Microlunatus panaciterrae TaxID=400768 RepID=A0ABS2RNA9_9ACTN|nr:universal stress protein [Microlunatus panaciterrae]MBM7800496.1 nucleotide-binding universal stress UspA family protein [Microlunatus panaciterrae]